MARKNEGSKRVKLLVGIIGRKEEKIYTEAVNSECVAFHFSGFGFGTAKSNYMSFLGLSEIEKRFVYSLIPEYAERQVLKAVTKALRLYLTGRGIAFTMPLSGISSIISDAVLSTPEKEEQTKTKGEKKMEKTGKLHDLIIAVVNQKYTDKALESARLAGATGATLLHTRSIGNERAEQVLGTALKQETDTIVLLSTNEFKTKIMEAIREAAGLKTDGGAVIFSLPVDSITGIGSYAEYYDEQDDAADTKKR